MFEKAKHYKELFLLFFLIWIIVNLWILQKFPQLQEFDFSEFSAKDLNILFFASFVSVIGIVMSSVYIHRLWKEYSEPGITANLLTGIYVAGLLLFGVLSVLIVGVIIYKTKKIERKNVNRPKDNEEE